MHSVNPLGDFIRARRAATKPDQVGLPDGRPRRTAGLRREEVALLAGVSEGYYARLEQGREKRPSDQVLNALIRVFRLDTDDAEYLHRLARRGTRTHGRSFPDTVDEASPDVLRLIAGWSVPALVLGPRLDVLGANRPGHALFPALPPRTNAARYLFLDPASRTFCLDWEEMAESAVAALRSHADQVPDDRRLTHLIGELSEKSEEFRALWDRYIVSPRAYQCRRFHHPEAGELRLAFQNFTVNDAPGQQLVTFQAEAGSASEKALARLLAAAGRYDPSGGTPSRSVPEDEA
ncbi:helix-turn-helix domain-containing protein [Streptomyces sp. NPDC091281]|uniref:helix-turn-helix domain-containing protein n=1 Tax=Streptomyces sp. NPDC091281 TaxID=3365985 RepID=UPI003803ABB4